MSLQALLCCFCGSSPVALRGLLSVLVAAASAHAVTPLAAGGGDTFAEPVPLTLKLGRAYLSLPPLQSWTYLESVPAALFRTANLLGRFDRPLGGYVRPTSGI